MDRSYQNSVERREPVHGDFNALLQPASLPGMLGFLMVEAGGLLDAAFSRDDAGSRTSAEELMRSQTFSDHVTRFVGQIYENVHLTSSCC